MGENGIKKSDMYGNKKDGANFIETIVTSIRQNLLEDIEKLFHFTNGWKYWFYRYRARACCAWLKKIHFMKNFAWQRVSKADSPAPFLKAVVK